MRRHIEMSLPDFRLEGKTALITGAKRGIGKALALAFAEAGADVAVSTRVFKDDNDDLAVVAEDIQRLGRRSLAIQADATKKIDVDSMVQTAVDTFGAIDILVNNVGGSRSSEGGPSALHISKEDWQYTLDLSLTSCYLCCEAVAQRMMERRTGSIVNIASGAGLLGNSSAYGIAKAGMIRLTMGLALELAGYNIRVNALAPTWIKTEMTRRLWDAPESLKRFEDRIPLGHRLGEVDDLTGPALFLASDASRFITGVTIPVDGGRVASGDYYLNLG